MREPLVRVWVVRVSANAGGSGEVGVGGRRSERDGASKAVELWPVSS